LKPGAEDPRATRKVWDPLVRIGHWLLVASVALAWITYRGGAWHERIGYLSLFLIALRVAWGWVGPAYARFSQFVRSPAATLRYVRAVAARREARHMGHNPLGAWMILALLTTVGLTDLTGWLYTTNAYWGDERVINMHLALAIILVVLVALHIAGVVITSLRHRENLIAAMIHGRKRPPDDDDVA
jgi:cytochrome b